MRKIAGLLLLISILSSCNLNGSSDKYFIEGTVKNHPAKSQRVDFDILRYTADGYSATSKSAGWMESAVFGHSFLLTRQSDEMGQPEYTLEARPTPRAEAFSADEEIEAFFGKKGGKSVDDLVLPRPDPPLGLG